MQSLELILIKKERI